MKRFSAGSIHKAISDAAVHFGCLEEEIEYEIAIEPSKGFLGFGKKDCVIVARKKEKIDLILCSQKVEENGPQSKCGCLSEEHNSTPASYKQRGVYTQIEENFFQERLDPEELCSKVASEIDTLFSFLPYNIDPVVVTIQSEGILNIEFSGQDCGLLIGEKGYRYSSIYHLLAIWLKKEYEMGLRLEIADFLKNKEKRIEEYLQENYDQIISRTFFQSRSFDPLTASIALRRFREAIPNKYIVIKHISEIESVISINEFRTK